MLGPWGGNELKAPVCSRPRAYFVELALCCVERKSVPMSSAACKRAFDSELELMLNAGEVQGKMRPARGSASVRRRGKRSRPIL